jgi:hypothetical protein
VKAHECSADIVEGFVLYSNINPSLNVINA